MQTTSFKFIALFTIPGKKPGGLLESADKRSPENGQVIFSCNLNFDLWLQSRPARLEAS